MIEIGIDANDLDVMTEFWSTALRYVRGYNDDERYRDLLPADGNGPTVFLQQVPERKTAKNRVHIDIYDFAPQTRIAELVQHGGTTIGEPVVDGKWWWQIMADPEGNEFCVCQEFSERKGRQ